MTTRPATDGARVLDPIEFHHTGVTSFFASQTDQRFSYCLYVPTAHQDETRRLPLVVIMHGTGRNAERYRTLCREFCEEHECVVVAPLFPAGIAEEGDLHGFKRILRHGIRYDRALLDIVDQVQARWRVDGSKFLLHGFSGGGQFSHRFADLGDRRTRGRRGRRHPDRTAHHPARQLGGARHHGAVRPDRGHGPQRFQSHPARAALLRRRPGGPMTPVVEQPLGRPCRGVVSRRAGSARTGTGCDPRWRRTSRCRTSR